MPAPPSPSPPFTLASLRHAAFDLGALALAAVAVFTGQRWAFYAVAGYTAFLLVVKLGALVAKMRPAPPADAPPDVVYHLIYALTLGVFVAGSLTTGQTWWGFVAAWAAIWAVSAVASRR